MEQTVIQKKLSEKGMSTYALAKKIKRNKPRVYEVTKGLSRATEPFQNEIAKALEMPKCELFTVHGMAKIAG